MSEVKSEVFRKLVSVKGVLFHYDPSQKGGLGAFAEEDAAALRRGGLSPWAKVLSRRQAHYDAGSGWDEEEWGVISGWIDSLGGLPLGGSQVWDGPSGHPVIVERGEDPEGPYWMLSGAIEGVFSTAVDVLRALGSMNPR